MLSEAAPGFLKRPDHFVIISTSTDAFELEFRGSVIASSSSVLEVDEKGYDRRLYFPKADINMSALIEVEHNTYCPFKGQARYWTVSIDDQQLINGAWGYDAPYMECMKLVDHVCFYLEKPDFKLALKD